MKLAYSFAFAGALLITTMSAGTLAQTGSAEPGVIPALPSASVLAVRAMHGSVIQGANRACTGTSADAEVCKGWQAGNRTIDCNSADDHYICSRLKIDPYLRGVPTRQ